MHGHRVLIPRILISLFIFLFCFQPLPARAGEPDGFQPLVPQNGNIRLRNTLAEIDYSNAGQGYIMCRYFGTNDKVVIQMRRQHDGVLYSHLLRTDGVFEAIAFAEGNGIYEVSVWEHLDEKRYNHILSVDITVELADEYLPFLYASARVPFTADSACTAKARELTLGIVSTPEKVEAVYRFVTGTVEYDRELARLSPAWYRSDPDRVLRELDGICVDYAVLTTAMLRSLGIPARVEYGTAPQGVYHAWISVFTDTEGKIGNRVLKAERWTRLDPTFDADAGDSAL